MSNTKIARESNYEKLDILCKGIYKRVPPTLKNEYISIMDRINRKCIDSEMASFQVKIKTVGGFYAKSIKTDYDLNRNKETEKSIRDFEQLLGYMPMGITWKKNKVEEEGWFQDNYLKYDYIVEVNNDYIRYLYCDLINNGFYLALNHIFLEEINAREFMKNVEEKHLDIVESIGSYKNVVVTRTGIYERVSGHNKSILRFEKYGLANFSYNWQCLGFLMAYCKYYYGKTISDIDDVVGRNYDYYEIKAADDNYEHGGSPSSFEAIIRNISCTIKETKKLEEW